MRWVQAHCATGGVTITNFTSEYVGSSLVAAWACVCQSVGTSSAPSWEEEAAEFSLVLSLSLSLSLSLVEGVGFFFCVAHILILAAAGSSLMMAT